MDTFKFSFPSQSQLESLSLDKFFLTAFKILTCHEVFTNFIFIIAPIFCGNHLNM